MGCIYRQPHYMRTGDMCDSDENCSAEYRGDAPAKAAEPEPTATGSISTGGLLRSAKANGVASELEESEGIAVAKAMALAFTGKELSDEDIRSYLRASCTIEQGSELVQQPNNSHYAIALEVLDEFHESTGRGIYPNDFTVWCERQKRRTQ